LEKPRWHHRPAVATIATNKAIKAKTGADLRLKQAQKAAMRLKQVSDPTRLQVILMLAEGEKHVGAVCEQLKHEPARREPPPGPPAAWQHHRPAPPGQETTSTA